MTKAQKEKRAAFNGTLFIIVLALVIGSAIVNAVVPKTAVTVAVSTAEAKVGVKYDTSEFKPFVQYFKHYQVKYLYAGDNWLIDSVSIDSTYEQIMDMYCDGQDNNDEGQNCILVGGDSIKMFFEQLAELQQANI